MKRMLNRILLSALCVSCTLLFTGCAQMVAESMNAAETGVAIAESNVQEAISEMDVDKEELDGMMKELEKIANEISQEAKEWENSALLTSYNWQGTQDGSLLVFEEDNTFRYYQSADDLTNYYFEGTYQFFIGAEAVTYLTTTLSDYGVTLDEINTIFLNNEQYYEANFMIYVLNNEACMIDGENTVDSPYQNPYMGFCLEENGTIYLDVANMNSANYSMYASVAK